LNKRNELIIRKVRISLSITFVPINIKIKHGVTEDTEKLNI